MAIGVQKRAQNRLGGDPLDQDFAPLTFNCTKHEQALGFSSHRPLLGVITVTLADIFNLSPVTRDSHPVHTKPTGMFGADKILMVACLNYLGINNDRPA